MITLVLTPLPGLRLQARPSAFTPQVRDQFRLMPGVNWRRSVHAYEGDFIGTMIVAQRLETAKVARLVEVRKDLESAAPQITASQIRLAPGLRDFQHRGALWIADCLHSTGSALLADEMGVGKTRQAIAALTLSPQPLVICPAIAIPHWRREITEILGSDALTHWELISYDRFRSQASKVTRLASHVVLDEISYLSNHRSQRSKAIAKWLAALPTRPYVIGLSGTPMTSDPHSLWHPLDVLWPGRFGAWWDFTHRYCDGRDEEIPGLDRVIYKYDGATHTKELRERLAPLMLRRTKAQVIQELPDLTRSVIDIALTATARRAAQKAAQAVTLGSNPGASSQAATRVLGSLESHKIKAAIELARDVRQAGSNPIILTLLRTTARQIGMALGAPVVTGEHDPLTREAKLAAAEIGVATIDSVTTAITLTNFDVAIVVGLPWLPWILQQAMARLHRIGQRRNVTAYFLVGEGTLDEVVRERVIDRLDSFAQVIGEGGEKDLEALRGGSDDELIAAMVADVERMTR